MPADNLEAAAQEKALETFDYEVLDLSPVAADVDFLTNVAEVDLKFYAQLYGDHDKAWENAQEQKTKMNIGNVEPELRHTVAASYEKLVALGSLFIGDNDREKRKAILAAMSGNLEIINPAHDSDDRLQTLVHKIRTTIDEVPRTMFTISSVFQNRKPSADFTAHAARAFPLNASTTIAGHTVAVDKLVDVHPQELIQQHEMIARFNRIKTSQAESQVMIGLAYGRLVGSLDSEEVQAVIHQDSNAFTDPRLQALSMMIWYEDPEQREGVQDLIERIAKATAQAEGKEHDDAFVAQATTDLKALIAVPANSITAYHSQEAVVNNAKDTFEKVMDYKIALWVSETVIKLKAVVDHVGRQVARNPSEAIMRDALAVDDYKTYMLGLIDKAIDAGVSDLLKSVPTMNDPVGRAVKSMRMPLADRLKPKSVEAKVVVAKPEEDPATRRERIKLNNKLTDLHAKYTVNGKELRNHDGFDFAELIKNGWTHALTKQEVIKPTDIKEARAIAEFVVSMVKIMEKQGARNAIETFLRDVENESEHSSRLAELRGDEVVPEDMFVRNGVAWVMDHLAINDMLADYRVPTEEKNLVPEPVRKLFAALQEFIEFTEASVQEKESA